MSCQGATAHSLETTGLYEWQHVWFSQDTEEWILSFLYKYFSFRKSLFICSVVSITTEHLNNNRIATEVVAPNVQVIVYSNTTDARTSVIADNNRSCTSHWGISCDVSKTENIPEDRAQKVGMTVYIITCIFSFWRRGWCFDISIQYKSQSKAWNERH